MGPSKTLGAQQLLFYHPPGTPPCLCAPFLWVKGRSLSAIHDWQDLKLENVMIDCGDALSKSSKSLSGSLVNALRDRAVPRGLSVVPCGCPKMDPYSRVPSTDFMGKVLTCSRAPCYMSCVWLAPSTLWVFRLYRHRDVLVQAECLLNKDSCGLKVVKRAKIGESGRSDRLLSGLLSLGSLLQQMMSGPPERDIQSGCILMRSRNCLCFLFSLNHNLARINWWANVWYYLLLFFLQCPCCF